MVEQRPDKTPDVFASAFVVDSGPYGMTLSFYRPTARTHAKAPVSDELVGTVRMTLEHGLMMTYMLWEHLAKAQKAHGRVAIPDVVMKASGVDPRAWGLFWHGEEPLTPGPAEKAT